MLHFYGLVLIDENTGRVERHHDASHAERQLANLNSSPHNFLRISRILTSLGELGFRRYKEPLFACLEEEVENGTLRNARASLRQFWCRLVGDEAEESAWYTRKTLESPSDREEGCLFAKSAENAIRPGTTVPSVGLQLPKNLPTEDSADYPFSPTWPPRIAPPSPQGSLGLIS